MAFFKFGINSLLYCNLVSQDTRTPPLLPKLAFHVLYQSRENVSETKFASGQRLGKKRPGPAAATQSAPNCAQMQSQSGSLVRAAAAFCGQNVFPLLKRTLAEHNAAACALFVQVRVSEEGSRTQEAAAK